MILFMLLRFEYFPTKLDVEISVFMSVFLWEVGFHFLINGIPFKFFKK